MAHLRLTSKREYTWKHYCPECADNEREVQDELARAYQVNAVEISEDVVDEKCAHCGRPIVSVQVEKRAYRIELDVTFTVAIDLVALSATAADLQFARELEKVHYEVAREAIGDEISDEIEEPEIENVQVEFSDEELEPAKLVPRQVAGCLDVPPRCTVL